LGVAAGSPDRRTVPLAVESGASGGAGTLRLGWIRST
jgi:hypothetical protein